MPRSTARAFLPLFAALALTGLTACSTLPTAALDASTAPAQPDPLRMVATIRAAAGSGEGELAVAPLRDPMVEDLRQQAVNLEKAGQYAESAAALDHALQLVPDDPAVLQERAEAAVLLKDFTGAEERARRAYALGAKLGPLCRRHWATVRAVRFAASDGAGAAQAQQQMDACKVGAIERF